MRVISEQEAARQQQITDDELLRLALRIEKLEGRTILLVMGLGASWLVMVFAAVAAVVAG